MLMKKFLLSMFFVLTATLGIQAQKVSLDFTSNTWGLPEASANKAVDAATFTSGDYSVILTGSTGNGYYFNTDGYLMLGKNGASLALPAFDFAVSKIEVVGRTGASTGTLENIYVGETAVSTQCKGSATTNSFQIAESHQAAGNVYVLKIESKHNAQITTINIYEASSEPTEPEGGEGEGEGETEVTYTTIAEVLAAGAGEATTKGTVVATYARGFLMSDATGSILVYLGSDKGFVAGDAVTVSGSTTVYGGLLQFGNTSVVEKTGTATVEHPTATVMDGAAMDAYLAAPAIQYVEYTGTLTINNNYYNVAIEGAATAVGSIQYPQDDIKNNLTTGSVVKVTGYLIGTSSSKYVNTMAVKVETVENGEEPEEAKSYTVTEALAAYVDGQKIPAIVTGYIVGTINGQAYTEGCSFSGTAESATNLLIADNAEETDPAKCMPVQLPKGDVRSALNLVDNPDNYKKQVKLTGSLEKYFSIAGLKSVTAYEFTGATGVEKVEIRNEKSEIYDLTGRRVESITAPGIYIINGKKMLVK